jgi:serralysin
VLVGTPAADTLTGTDANDTFVGGVGADTLRGRLGDDLYVLDANTPAIVDTGGIDTIVSTITRSLAGFPAIENLVLAAGDIDGTGNSLANTITGTSGNNRLFGGDGTDTLNGGNGNDFLDGGAGFDTLRGGAGNDTYALGNDNNAVVDAGGNDLATTTITRSMLGGGLSTVERLTLLSGNISATGNGLANVIIGSAGANILRGGLGNDRLSGGLGNDKLYGEAGKDTLTGGQGRDVFAFTTALGSHTNVDRITDFGHRDDTIQLSHLFFKGMGTGGLKAKFFHAGTHAQDADDHIIYNKATGALYYDSDGTGAHAQVLFAIVANHASAGLASNDLVLI